MFTLFYPWAIKFLTFCLMSYKFEAERHEAAKEIAGGKKSEQHPYHPHPKPSSVHSAVGGVCIKNRTLQPPTSVQELTINLPQILV